MIGSRAAVRAATTAALVATLLGSADAAADDEPSAQVEFDAGRRAMARGDYALARTHFEASYRVDPAIGTVLNLAVCEERLGRLTAARAKLEEGLKRAPAGDERRPSIEARLRELDTRIPRLALRSSRPLDDVEIRIDGVDVPGPASRVLAVDPGSHEITCLRRAERVCLHRVVLGERQERELWLEIEALPRAKLTPPPARARPEQRAPSRLPVYVPGAIGLAGLGMAALGTVQVLREKANVERHCDASGCDESGIDAASRGKTWSNLASVGAAVAVVGLGTSAWLFLTLDPASSSRAGVVARGHF